MKININELVKIKLTNNGKEIYNNYLSQLHPHLTNKSIPEELTLPLWELAQIFGKELYNGQVKAPFFEKNEIELLKK